jgi:FlaA1/EpsC-like NDP-sugar epimerase
MTGFSSLSPETRSDRARLHLDASALVTHSNFIHSGKTILVTGAGGCIGSELAGALAGFDPKLLILLDHSEQNLYEVQSQFSAALSHTPHVPVLGDISDEALLAELFEPYRPDCIYHAAAFKHVPLMEANPIAVIRNNVLGTWVLPSASPRCCCFTTVRPTRA